MIVPGDQAHRFVVHDRDTIYSEGVDRTLEALGLVVLRTPVRAPQANAYCERLIGTIRRECLDFVIPLNERHLRAVLRDWCSHYNLGRPHASRGTGIPERPLDDWTGKATGHRLPDGYRVAASPILGGLLSRGVEEDDVGLFLDALEHDLAAVARNVEIADVEVR